jgi:hypothetical protein
LKFSEFEAAVLKQLDLILAKPVTKDISKILRVAVKCAVVLRISVTGALRTGAAIFRVKDDKNKTLGKENLHTLIITQSAIRRRDGNRFFKIERRAGGHIQRFGHFNQR